MAQRRRRPGRAADPGRSVKPGGRSAPRCLKIASGRVSERFKGWVGPMVAHAHNDLPSGAILARRHLRAWRRARLFKLNPIGVAPRAAIRGWSRQDPYGSNFAQENPLDITVYPRTARSEVSGGGICRLTDGLQLILNGSAAIIDSASQGCGPRDDRLGWAVQSDRQLNLRNLESDPLQAVRFFASRLPCEVLNVVSTMRLLSQFD